MATLDDLRRALQAQMDAKQDVLQSWPALLGRVSDGLVPVAGRAGYVHVRIGSDETAGQARNKRVPDTYDLAVYVGYDGISPEFQVLSIRQEDWVGAGYAPIPEVGPHGATHTWPTEADGAADGSDVTYVAWRQILSLRIGTTAVAFQVEVGRGPLFRVGTGLWEWIATQQLNLAGDQPAIGARWVLVYLDSAGVLQRRLGAIVAPSNALLFSDCPAPLGDEFPLAAVRLYAGQTGLTETRTEQDIVDLRFQASGGGGASHDILSVTHSGTTPAAVVRGDLMTGQGVVPLWTRLAHPAAANRVLQSTALEMGWSAGSLVLGGFTLTVPATGTAVIGGGTGLATRIAYWTDANTLASDAGLVYNAATDTITIAGAINPVAAAGQNLGDATHRWKVYAAYVDAGNGGWFGILGNERLIVNAIGNFTFAGVTSVVVPDDCWVGADANCAWMYDLTNSYVTTLDKVGIGTRIPAADCHIEGATGFTKIIIKDTAVNSSPGFSVRNDVQRYDFRIDGAVNDIFEIFDVTAGNLIRFVIDTSGNMALGGVTAPLAKLHVDQPSATATIPVLYLDQADLSEEFIELATTVGAGNPIDTAAVGGGYYGKMRVSVAGVGHKYIPLYNA